MPKNAQVNPDTCIGCGACVAIAGKSFKMNDSGKSIAINPAGDDQETIQKAIDSCPVNAIAWGE